MVETKLRMAFVHNAYIDYRTPLFEKISEKYDVHFFFEWADQSFVKNSNSIRLKILRSFRFVGEYAFSPLLFFFLLKGKFNLFIAGGKGQVNTYVAYVLSRLLRKPFIFWDETWYWPRTRWRLLAWPMIRSLLKNASAIVVPGIKSNEFYLSITPCGENKIFIAPNASVLSQREYYRLRADEARKKLRLDNKKVILYCGRLLEQKGIEYLIEALAKLQKSNRNVFLFVLGGPIGDGTKCDPKELKNMCRSFGINNVRFLGPVYGPEKTVYFLLADILVVPSVFFTRGAEVWGFAVNEAMSVSKPVIATKAVGAAYDLIKDGVNGYIVPDKNPEALCKAIKLIINNPSNEKRMGIQSSKILFDGFSYDHMFRGFVEAIEYALRNG